MKITFCDLEKKYKINWQSSSSSSSLTEWYSSIRNTPVESLAVGDLCRAIRQGIYVLEVVPVALEFLREDFLAGFKYDGELIVALGELSSEFWSENRVMADEVFLIVDSFVYSGIDASLAIDILVLKERTRGR